ncbi:MAG: dTDP-4-dehydrorhamnose 3,5-epimerase [bacterium]
MKIIDTPLDGLKVFEPKVFGDSRGYFMETWNSRVLSDKGFDITFVQDNESQSSKGTLRGIHFQKEHPQGKLVRAVRGEVFDIAVDLRPESTTYGQWYGCILSEQNKLQMWVPEGFGHAYYTISDKAVFVYKCTDYYYADDQYSLSWEDPDVGIEWPLCSNTDIILSDNDRDAKSLREITELLGGRET